MIEQYQTRNPEFGYNICAGGGGTEGLHHTEESRRKISEGLRGEKNPNFGGKSCSPEWREKQRQANLGKHHSEEHKKHISEGLRGKIHHTEEYKQEMSRLHSHAVERDDGVVFDSVKKAAESMGVTYTAISNAIRRNQRCGGYHWKYVESKA